MIKIEEENKASNDLPDILDETTQPPAKVPFDPSVNLIHGQSPGRKKVDNGFKMVLKMNEIPALMTIVSIMNDTRARSADRLKAAELIIDRLYGKAVQPIGGEEGQPLVVKLAGVLDDWSK